ncbi:MAG: hypothetical protein FJ253_05570 [Phycisphaerae bacterium]|nr:hypothetical protein [Phycisphaerae bacterium]
MFRPVVLISGIVIVTVLVLFNTTYTVNFHELAIRTRLGKPPEVEKEPGLHFKAPFFIDSVSKIDTRLQLVESPLETLMTRDGQQIMIQAFLLWRIDQQGDAPLRFNASFPSLEDAKKNLEPLLQGSLREVGGFAFTDLIGPKSKLPDAEAAVLADLRRAPPAGVLPVQVGINQVVLPPKTTTAVQRRMATSQENLAAFETSQANALADSLQAQAAAQADIIRNLAKVWGAEIESRGDREAARYYKQMQSEAELAIFLKWLDTLRTSLSGSSTFVTDMSRAPFHLLNPRAPTDANGIPLPSQDAGGEPIGGAGGAGSPRGAVGAGAGGASAGGVNAGTGSP